MIEDKPAARATRPIIKTEIFNDIANSAIFTADEHMKRFPEISTAYDNKFIRRQYEELVPWAADMDKEFNVFVSIFHERMRFNKKIDEFKVEYLKNKF